jgi:hypothetical protein
LLRPDDYHYDDFSGVMTMTKYWSEIVELRESGLSGDKLGHALAYRSMLTHGAAVAFARWLDGWVAMGEDARQRIGRRMCGFPVSIHDDNVRPMETEQVVTITSSARCSFSNTVDVTARIKELLAEARAARASAIPPAPKRFIPPWALARRRKR